MCECLTAWKKSMSIRCRCLRSTRLSIFDGHHRPAHCCVVCSRFELCSIISFWLFVNNHFCFCSLFLIVFHLSLFFFTDPFLFNISSHDSNQIYLKLFSLDTLYFALIYRFKLWFPFDCITTFFVAFVSCLIRFLSYRFLVNFYYLLFSLSLFFILFLSFSLNSLLQLIFFLTLTLFYWFFYICK